GLLGPSFNKLGIDGLTAAYGKDTAMAIIRESLEGYTWLKDFIAREEIDCDLKISGRFRGISHPKHMDYLKKQVDDLNDVIHFPAEFISKAEQHSEIGSDYYHGGIIYHLDGSLQPALYTKGLLSKVVDAGGLYFEHSKVNHVQRHNQHFQIQIGEKKIKAQDVLIATNGYSGKEFNGFRRRIMPIRSAIIATEELPAKLIQSLSPKNRSHGGTERIVSYYRLSPDGRRLVFGSRAPGGTDNPQKFGRFLYDFMLRIFPQLEGTKIDYAWSGLVAYSFDHVPHLGVMNHMHFAMGYCGSGVVRASYFGHKIANQLMGQQDGKTPYDNLPFKGPALYTGRPWFLAPIIQWHAFLDRHGL
ncbi:MAG: FAD-binding oxidoreductase, partial [Alphaproteobacteria bacterium]|nr:FAD-binding oxidoreductase [Alphaproteobacteria bacterium]